MEIKLTKDGQDIGMTDVPGGGEFSFREVGLDMGVNQFTAIATSKDGVSSDMSKVLNVTYDNQSPVFKLTNPAADNVTVDSADFDVTGESEEKGVSVLVNGNVAMVSSEGKFKIKLQLNQGKNDVEVIVRDVAGNESRKKVVVTYDI